MISTKATSTKWYVTFTDDNDLLQEDLLWSYAYYKKNVEESLYATVHLKWMAFAPEERGGALFLKLLLDQVTTTIESNLKALIDIVETYQTSPVVLEKTSVQWYQCFDRSLTTWTHSANETIFHSTQHGIF